MRLALLISALMFSLVLCQIADTAYAQDAQTSKQTERQKRREALKAREVAEKRIEADMINMSNLVEALSKNMGQLHYLRTLCYGNGDQKWREYADQMVLVESRGDTDDRRRLVRAFNAGYYEEEARFKVCSGKVSVDAAALAENGRHIATMLSDPYRER